jgi:hypothetical protein
VDNTYLIATTGAQNSQHWYMYIWSEYTLGIVILAWRHYEKYSMVFLIVLCILCNISLTPLLIRVHTAQ